MNITLIDMLVVNGADGKPTQVNISEWPPEFVAYMLAYAHGVRMQRCTASVDKADFTKTRQAMFDSMVAGELPTGGGSSGPRQTIEEAGRVAFYNSKGGIKVKGQTCNGKNLAEYDAMFTRKAIWDDLRDMMIGMDSEAQREFVKNDIPGYVQDNLENALALAQKDTKPGFMGDYIESERRKRNPVAETFKVKMVIKPKA